MEAALSRAAHLIFKWFPLQHREVGFRYAVEYFHDCQTKSNSPKSDSDERKPEKAKFILATARPLLCIPLSWSKMLRPLWAVAPEYN